MYEREFTYQPALLRDAQLAGISAILGYVCEAVSRRDGCLNTGLNRGGHLSPVGVSTIQSIEGQVGRKRHKVE